MAVVVDANLPIVLAVDDDRASIVTRQLQTWLQAGEDLHAPTLLPYEVASGLTRLVAAGALPEERVPDAFQSAMAVPITYHPLEEQGPRTVAIALKLGRKSAHDAAYLALAEQLDAELWTFDGPLARNAAGLGFRVHLIE